MSTSLLDTLAEMLKRVQYKTLPLPYVWYHGYQDNWWLSTESGSKAIGTFEQTVSALRDLSNDQSHGSAARADTVDSFVRPSFPSNVMGGRGVCRYCGEAVNNVAYHESNACKRRPNNG